MDTNVQFNAPVGFQTSTVEYSSRLLADLTSNSEKVLVSTSFGPGSAVLLKLVTDLLPAIPVIWVDTGHNTDATYRFVEKLRARLDLNLHTYHAKRSAAHQLAIRGQLPDIDACDLSEFAEETKLEPFRRALAEHAPHYWINGIRQQDNEHRHALGVISPGPLNTIKVAPLFHWTDPDMQNYLTTHALPDETRYFDPTKVLASRECGLHCRL